MLKRCKALARACSACAVLHIEQWSKEHALQLKLKKLIQCDKRERRCWKAERGHAI